MRNNKNKYARLAPTTILTAWIVFAMSPLVHATEYSLPEVVVTVKPMMSNSPMIGRDVSKLDMTAWNSHNAAEALVQTPGVNVQYGGSSGDARAWIRGFRHRDVLILFDGIPIASAFEGTIDLNEITLSNVAEVKVLTGAPSVIYGANGMGGVIDFIPSDGLRDQALTGRLEVGKNSTWRADADFGGNAGAVNYYVSGSYDTSDGFELSDDYVPQLNEDGGLRTNSDHLRKNVFGYASAESSALGKTSVFVNFSDAERGFNLEAGEDDPDFERLAESKRQTVGLSNQFESIPLSAKLFYNSYDSQLNIYTDATYSEIDEIEITEDYSIGGMLYSSLQLNDKNLLVLSAAYRTDKFEGVGAFDDFDKASLDTITLAAEDQFDIGDRMSVAIGGIYSRFDQPEANRDISEFNPQIVVGYRLADAWFVHASAAQRTRFPKLRELYRRKWGNPELDVQTAENYELGFRYAESEGLTADFTLFLSNVDDLIERPDRNTTYQNLDEITFKGVDTAVGGWLTENLFGRAAYTFLDAAEELPDGSERQLRSRARHTVYGELRYQFPYDIMLYLNSVYSDGLYDLDGNQTHVKLPSYFLLHTKASIGISESLSTYISISNVTDTDYLHRLGYPREGRAIRVGVSFEM
jgi:iron complex outermembrane receptor protein